MLFSSPFVRKHLLQIQSKQQPEHDVDRKCHPSSRDGVVVNYLGQIAEVELQLYRVAINCQTHGQDESSVGRKWPVQILLVSYARRASDYKTNHELHNKEQQRDNDSHLSSSEEHLNKEALND